MDAEYQFQLGDLRREVMLQALTYVHDSLRTGSQAAPVSNDALDEACIALADKLRACPSCGGPKPVDAHIAGIEEIRLRTARRRPQTAAEGDTIADVMLLLSALDAALTHANSQRLRSAITQAFADAGGV